MARALLLGDARMPRAVQPSGSPRGLLLVALPFATLGCARGASDETPDARAMPDAVRQSDAATDATELTADAPVSGCAIANGISIAIDGNDDLAKYPAAQHVTPGAMLGSDAAAIAWDKTHLFVTVTSNAFTAPYEPLHVYLETGTTLSPAVGAQGKEYGGLVPALPFAASQLVAARRVSDSGTGGYDGVYVPSDGWMTRALALDTNTFVSADHKTLSVRVPWTALGGCPTTMRLAQHVVHGASANEWKDLVPSTHTPWQTPGGGYYEIDLTATPAIASWTLR